MFYLCKKKRIKEKLWERKQEFLELNSKGWKIITKGIVWKLCRLKIWLETSAKELLNKLKVESLKLRLELSI